MTLSSSHGDAGYRFEVDAYRGDMVMMMTVMMVMMLMLLLMVYTYISF